eukprot:scaffold156722_cov22-Tisochrysis_lutea.AAC.3
MCALVLACVCALAQQHVSGLFWLMLTCFLFALSLGDKLFGLLGMPLRGQRADWGHGVCRAGGVQSSGGHSFTVRNLRPPTDSVEFAGYSGRYVAQMRAELKSRISRKTIFPREQSRIK